MFARLSAWWSAPSKQEHQGNKEFNVPLTEAPGRRTLVVEEREENQEEKKLEEEKAKPKVEETKSVEKNAETENQEALALLTELNSYDNLKTSAERLELQLRAQLKSMLDPEVYNKLIVEATREQSGRYSVVTEDKKDLSYYYQHALNFLSDFQRLMVPVSHLHNKLTKLVSKHRAWDKAKQLYWDGKKLNRTLNDLGIAYNEFLWSMQGLELDTALGHLPTFFQDFKQWLLSSGFVQASRQHFSKTPFVESYHNNGDRWRELLGLPPAQSQPSLNMRGWEEDEDLDENPVREQEEKKDAPHPSQPVLEEKARVEEGALKKLQKMELMKTALNKILADLSGSEISESVRNDYQKTIELTSQILRKIDLFSKKEQSWKNFIAFAYDLSPTIKDLLVSLPQSYSALNKILREHFLTMARQLNWIIREAFLYLDHLESDFYLKDGLIQHLGEGGRNCGLFIIDNDPNLATTQGVLNEILSEGSDAYLYFRHNLYYINRYQKKQGGEWAIHVKKLRYCEPPEKMKAQPEEKKEEEEENTDPSPMYKALRTYLNLPPYEPFSVEVYRCIYPNLQPHHLHLIRDILTKPEAGKLTGRYRDPDLYQSFRLSLANMAQEFQRWITWWGYEFIGTERYPYTQASLEQRQDLLEEENERLAEMPKHLKKNYCKQEFLARRFLNKTEELLKEEKQAILRKQEEKEQLAHYKHWLVKTQIDERIGELESEITVLGSLVSQVKQKKILLLKRLWRSFEKHPGETCQAALLDLGLTSEELHLLEEGRTGKLITTLRALTFTPADRNALIQVQLEHRRQDQAQAASSYFFASRRQKQFEQRADALEELGRVLRPCDRMQEVLDYLSAKKPEHFAALQYETQLLADLRSIDQFTPDSAFGLKPLDFANSTFEEFEANRQAAKESRRALRDGAKKTREGPKTHFFKRDSFIRSEQKGPEQASALAEPPLTPVATPTALPLAPSQPASTPKTSLPPVVTPFRF